jgi:hypothetical protein
MHKGTIIAFTVMDRGMSKQDLNFEEQKKLTTLVLHFQQKFPESLDQEYHQIWQP